MSLPRADSSSISLAPLPLFQSKIQKTAKEIRGSCVTLQGCRRWPGAGDTGLQDMSCHMFQQCPQLRTGETITAPGKSRLSHRSVNERKPLSCLSFTPCPQGNEFVPLHSHSGSQNPTVHRLQMGIPAQGERWEAEKKGNSPSKLSKAELCCSILPFPQLCFPGALFRSDSSISF